ncbi:putative DNA-binding domain-containing protein [Phenylobacterium sp.]|uniref:HvfC/BufC family peptide modification chaperone n=1 Tax=Phenylobacterium sp. TaxID=1871053 RepID=UPI0025F2471E|nr:putative DNA-binding domain-containing protein [Phenylobacterium sp.]
MREAFHDRFLAAVAGDDAALAPWCETPQAGLSVYRNTMAKACADALVAQFPTVERVVGPAWLAAAATAHAAVSPPRQGSLLTYGAAFPDWLRRFPPAANLAFLPGLAQLDLLWTEAHLAADAAPLDPEAVAGLPPDAFGTHALVLHSATRFAGFDDTTPRLWQALQPPGEPPDAFELEPEPQGLLFVRPGLDIAHQTIGPGALAFLAACRDGDSAAAAAAAGLAAEPCLDLSATFARLLAAGAFAALRTLP